MKVSLKRECIKTGYCFECQSRIFNQSVPEDDSWGLQVGECSYCGAPIYSRKHMISDGYQCPNCLATLDNFCEEI